MAFIFLTVSITWSIQSSSLCIPGVFHTSQCVKWVYRDVHTATCSKAALLIPSASKDGCVCVENATKSDTNNDCHCKEGTYKLDNACHKKISTHGLLQYDKDRLTKERILHISTLCGYGSHNNKQHFLVLQYFLGEHWQVFRPVIVRVNILIDGVFQKELSKKFSISSVKKYSIDKVHGRIYPYKPWKDRNTTFLLSASFCAP
jgi:hypothetical protein